MNIGETLKQLLEKHDLNTLELSRRTGIGQPVIYRIMSGETDNPKIATVCALADYFGITVNQLIGEMALPELHTETQKPKLAEIPLLSWENAPEWPDLHHKSKHKILVDLAHDPNLYALKMHDESMEPLFPPNTLLIIDASKKPKDHSYVIVKSKKSKKVIFRQLLIDEDFQYLKPLNPDTDKHKMKLFNEKTDTYGGILVQAKMDYNDQ